MLNSILNIKEVTSIKVEARLNSEGILEEPQARQHTFLEYSLHLPGLYDVIPKITNAKKHYD